MDYNASITYRNPVPIATDRAVMDASRSHRLLGAACPVCSGSTPAVAATAPSTPSPSAPTAKSIFPRRHHHQLRHRHALSYPGQTETEPFVRAFVLLDGTDVVIGYAPVIELPADEVRVGQRVAAVWASPAEESKEGGMAGAWGSLLGWMPNGEPDVDNPDLVNRIF
jgi:hypothetical protein